jgi:phospholipase/carboxylesterase
MSNSSLLPVVEVTTGHDPQGTVIWLHGLGADGNDFVPVVKELGLSDELPLRFVFPHAPMRPVTINAGHVMRAWYDILALDSVERRADEQGIRESQRAVAALIAQEQARGIAPNRLVLAGFSQGGAIALHTGLRHPQRLAGILALSTYLPLAQTLQAEARPANRDTPIFIAHGSQDTMIPITLARTSREKLTESGYRPEWREYAMPHSVSLEEIQDIGSWLARVLASTPREREQ